MWRPSSTSGSGEGSNDRETIEDYAEQSSPHAALDSRVLGPSDLFGRRAEFCFFERRGVRVGVFERVFIGFEVHANRIVQGGVKRSGEVLSVST